MKYFKYDFGDRLRNVTNGDEGVVNSRLEYATGCKQYGLINKKDNDYYDEGQLKLITKSELKRIPKMVERYDIIETTETKEIGFRKKIDWGGIETKDHTSSID